MRKGSFSARDEVGEPTNFRAASSVLPNLTHLPSPMRHLLVPLFLLSLLHSGFCQKNHVMAGLNITQTLGNFFGTSGANTVADPFLLGLRVGNDQHRLRLGLNFRVRDTESFDLSGFSRTVNERRLDLRAGYERNYTLSDRFDLYWGLDAVLRRQVEEVETFVGGGFANLKLHSTGIGGGPVLGVMFRVSPRVRLSTESTLYAMYTEGENIVNAPPDVSKKPFKEFDFRPILPTSLFINFFF